MQLLLLLQHSLNALHVMAFLTRHGLSRPRALRLARRWERLAHAFLYYPTEPAINDDDEDLDRA